MTFIKKHLFKIFIILTAFIILFLLWYHLFPLKIPFDCVLYGENGEEAVLQGEAQYYRSLFKGKGRLYGKITFNGAAYDGRLGTGSPNAFMFGAEPEDGIANRGFFMVFFNEGYELSYAVEGVINEGTKMYFPQNSEIRPMGEASKETAITDTSKNDQSDNIFQAIGGYSELNRHFIDPVYDIHYVIDLRGDTVYDWADKIYKEMSREEVLSLPDLYRAIKEFDVTKEELISVKDPKLTLEIIDALYLEEEEMKKALASDLALVYDGDVYCYYDIMGLWGDEASKNTKSSLKKEIPESVKKEYSEKMKAYFIEMAGESYYNKIYKSQLESFLGVVSDSEKVTE